MGYNAVSNVATGDVLTASAYNNLIGNTMMGHPVYTNEAARDAAITSPSEGMMAYLTAPTVPAATGVKTAVPTGIVTIYNGSSWVCVTEVGAFTDTQGSTTSTAYTPTLTSGGTNPSVTLTTGTTAFVSMSLLGTLGTAANSVYASVAVSGATTMTSDNTGMAVINGVSNASYVSTLQAAMIVTGLTAGTNTFTLEYRTSNASATASFLNRRLMVKGIA